VENLSVTESFGANVKEGEDLERFLTKLIPYIERQVYEEISRRVNFLLTRVNDQKLEIVAGGNIDKDEDGNWRIIENSGDLIIQKRVNSTWTNADKISGS